MIDEDLARAPVTRKGKIRVEMERRLRQATAGVKALIVRAGDYFGPGGSANSWFGQMVKPGKPVRSAVYPGRREVGHAWAYLPDLAETMVRLVEREAELENFAVFNFGGTWFERGEDMARAILRVAERPGDRSAASPGRCWCCLALRAAVPRASGDALPVERPLRLDNAKLVAFLGAEPTTPLDRAVALTLEALGCLRSGVAGAVGRPCRSRSEERAGLSGAPPAIA